MVISGADLAIVDLNKEEAERQAQNIIDTFQKEHPNAKRSVPALNNPRPTSQPPLTYTCIQTPQGNSPLCRRLRPGLSRGVPRRDHCRPRPYRQPRDLGRLHREL
jgi:hypothetical protein